MTRPTVIALKDDG